jgi:hypothetical protein
MSLELTLWPLKITHVSVGGVPGVVWALQFPPTWVFAFVTSTTEELETALKSVPDGKAIVIVLDGPASDPVVDSANWIT